MLLEFCAQSTLSSLASFRLLLARTEMDPLSRRNVDFSEENIERSKYIIEAFPRSYGSTFAVNISPRTEIIHGRNVYAGAFR